MLQEKKVDSYHYFYIRLKLLHQEINANGNGKLDQEMAYFKKKLYSNLYYFIPNIVNTLIKAMKLKQILI